MTILEVLIHLCLVNGNLNYRESGEIKLLKSMHNKIKHPNTRQVQ